MADKDKNKQQGKGGGQPPAGTTPGQPPVTVPPAQTPAAPVAPAAQPPAKPLTAMEILGQRMTVLESRMLAVEEFITKGGVVGAGKGAPKAEFGGKRGAVPTKDTVTNMMYESKSALGKALAAENGMDPNDHYVWYELVKKFPGRFVDCNEAEAAQVMAARDARVQAEIDEANKKLAEQEAANNLAAQKK